MGAGQVEALSGRERARAKFQQIHQDSVQKVREVLNDDQKAKFDQMQARHKEHRGMHGNKGDTSPSDKQ